MLGKLAKWLRLLGFDAAYRPLSDPGDLVVCEAEGRIPVTRSRRWCAREGVVCLDANDSPDQLRELLLRLEIEPEEIHFLSRCVQCNQLIERVSREVCVGLVPDYVLETGPAFSRCNVCGKIYWRGTHPARMIQWFVSFAKGTRLEGWIPEIGGEGEG